MRKLVAIIMVALMCLAPTIAVGQPVEYGTELKYEAPAPTVSFTDVPQDYWAYRFIAEMINKNVMVGYPDGKFRPEKIVNRGEVATMLVKAGGIDAPKNVASSFVDIKDGEWLSPFVEAAKPFLTGFNSSTGYYYRPNSPAEREDIVVAIVKYKGYDARLADRNVIKPMFTDYDGISDGAKDYVAIAIEHGLVSGYSDETFRAKEPVTRAEMAAMLWRAGMYGDDNKSANLNNIAPPVRPVEPQSTAPATVQPQTNNVVIKANGPLTVDTLAGGSGSNKLGDVKSIAVLGNDIYFIDGSSIKRLSGGKVETLDYDFTSTLSYVDATPEQIEARNEQIKKLEAQVADLKEAARTNRGSQSDNDNMYAYWMQQARPIEASLASLKKTMQSTTIQVDNFTPHLLTAYNGSIYVLGGSRAGGSWYNFDWFQQVFKLDGAKPTMVAVSEIQKDVNMLPGGDFLAFVNSEPVCSDRAAWANSTVMKDDYEIRMGDNLEVLAGRVNDDLPAWSGKLATVASGGSLYIFDTGTSQLLKVDTYPYACDVVKQFTNKYQAVTSYGGKFYVANGGDISVLDINGNLQPYVKASKLKLNGGRSITSVGAMTCDENGNLIIYDSKAGSIRRINA